jgi:hypothetical protein
MKTFLKIIGGIAAVIVVAVAAVFYFTAGITGAADGFFEAVKNQDMVAARAYLSEEFKASTDEGALQDFLSTGGLSSVSDASWSNRQVSGGKGELEGIITSDNGGTVPVKLTLVKENGDWKIYHIQRTTPGLKAESSAPEIPAPDEQIAMVKQSMRDFTVSVDSKSMGYFYSTISQMWQDQVTVAELDEIFGVTYDANLDFASLDSVIPVLEPVSGLGENGELVLKGYYPTTPDQLHLQQKFVFENDRWKLMGFSFTIE